MIRCLLILPVFSVGAAVAECPSSPDVEADVARILAEVREAPNEMAARLMSNRLWEFWAKAPDEAAQALLDQGMTARASFDFLNAIEAFDRLVAYCPDYAEGYNQRAFVNFMREDYPAALVDLDAALARRPTHVAALAGKALTLMGLGRHEEAQEVLRLAVEMNPWLPERGLLRKPAGEDL